MRTATTINLVSYAKSRKVFQLHFVDHQAVTVSAFAARKKFWVTASSSPSTPVSVSAAEQSESGPSIGIKGPQDDDKPNKDHVNDVGSSAKSGRPLTRRSAAATLSANSDSSQPRSAIVEPQLSLQTCGPPSWSSDVCIF